MNVKPNTFIRKAPDSEARRGIVPNSGTIPALFHTVLRDEPYRHDERELQRKVHHEMRRRPDLRIENYNIRRSDLLKKLGWGLHADGDGKLAIYGCETEEYRRLASSSTLRVVDAFRTRRALER
ncbi:MAG: DUF6157 family protein [Actinomycetota bacterium]|nr:DUF6157 family protein [Actinomycetota bacterium]